MTTVAGEASAGQLSVVRTLAVADDDISLAGLQHVLDSLDTVQVVSSPGSADVGVVAASSFTPEVLLQVKELHAELLRVVVIVDQVDERGLLAAAQHGISGMLLRRQASASAVEAAILGAVRGDGTIPAHLVLRLLDAVAESASTLVVCTTEQVLATREAEVIRLLADGYDTAEIATAMSYSLRTVKNIVQGVKVRMNLRNRTHVVAWAIREGLL